MLGEQNNYHYHYHFPTQGQGGKHGNFLLLRSNISIVLLTNSMPEQVLPHNPKKQALSHRGRTQNSMGEVTI